MRNKRHGLKTLAGMCVTSWGMLITSHALAADGVIHIVGEITTPSCHIAPQTVAQMEQQKNRYVTRQACAKAGTTAIDTSSNFAVAQIESDTTMSKQDAAFDKQMLTLSYR